MPPPHAKEPTADKPSRASDGRQRLLETAIRMFAERGFDGVTVRDLAKEADVSIGLINHHFQSKEGLRAEVDRRFISRTARAIENSMGALADQNVDAVADAQRTWLLRYEDEWPSFAAYLRRAINENSPWGQRLFSAYFESITKLVESLDARGLVDERLDRKWLPWLYLFVICGPLIFDPYIQGHEGHSAYEPEAWAQLQVAIKDIFFTAP